MASHLGSIDGNSSTQIWSVRPTTALLLKAALDSLLPTKPPSQYTKSEKLELLEGAIKVIRRIENVDFKGIWIAKEDIAVKAITKGGKNSRLDLICEYYGSRIGIYFAWLKFYRKYLEVPAAAGCALFLFEWYIGDTDSPLIPWFGILMALWSTLLLELWKQHNAELVCKWGALGVEDHDSLEDILKVE